MKRFAILQYFITDVADWSGFRGFAHMYQVVIY